jgi:hypothetical protein
MHRLDDSTYLFASNIGAGMYHWRQRQVEWFELPPEQRGHGQFRNILLDSNGLIWTNSAAGIYRSISPVRTSNRTRLLLTGYKVQNGQTYNGFADQVIDLGLEDFQNAIDISFALANPTEPKQVQFSYHLSNFDRDWVDAGNRHFVRYANLPGGRYGFSVRAVDGDGYEQVRQLLTFEIATPFYKTWWFICATAFVLLGLVAAVIRFYLRQSQLKTQYELKLTKMEMQSLRSQMNPHFIFNSLNSIKNYVVNKGPDEAAAYLAKFSRLIRLILENSKSETLTLEQEIEALKLYLDIERLRFDESFECEFTIDPQVDLASRVPPMLIQPHVENAIWHGLRHQKERGRLTITFSPGDRGIICTVTDNGIGRQQAAALHMTRSRHKKSLGLQITTERIEMINRIHGAKNHVEVRDLLHPDGTPAGTRVIIFIDQHNGA